MDVYVPVVDWGVRAEPYRAPVAVELEFRSLDRDAALAALRNGGSADASLAGARGRAARRGLRRPAPGGGLRAPRRLVGGLLGGAVAGVFTRRRWLLLGPAAGLAVDPRGGRRSSASGVSRFDYGALREPTFYAHGEELPRLLEFSERVLAAGEGYEDSYGDAVEGLTRLIAVAGERAERAGADRPRDRRRLRSPFEQPRPPGARGLHGGKPVFIVGDLTQRGTQYESGIVPGLARLGSPVVAVSGNHDSRPLMLAAARSGVIVLTRSGRSARGRNDDRRPGRLGRRPARGGLGRSARERHRHLRGPPPGAEGAGAPGRASGSSSTGSRRCPSGPTSSSSTGTGSRTRSSTGWLPRAARPVLDPHRPRPRQHVESEGAYVLVDGGTVGAGGAFGVGEEHSGFALVHLDADEQARAVDLVEVEPESGSASAHRVVLQRARARRGRGRRPARPAPAGSSEQGGEWQRSWRSSITLHPWTF